jgi:hypothetical protein
LVSTHIFSSSNTDKLKRALVPSLIQNKMS